ncbi:MAG: hypothetical protein V3S98_04045 [Dehalococcoidia bacterium]
MRTKRDRVRVLVAALLGVMLLQTGCVFSGDTDVVLSPPQDVRPTQAEPTPRSTLGTPTGPNGIDETPVPDQQGPDAPVVAVVPSEASVGPGGTAFFTAVVIPNGARLTGADLRVDAPAAELAVSNVEPGDLLGNIVLVGVKTIEASGAAGRLSIARIGTTDRATESGNLALIEVRVGEDATPGTYRVELELTLVDSQLTRLARSVQGAVVRVR